MKALEWLEKHDMATVNANSISTAKLSGVVIGALGGGADSLAIVKTIGSCAKNGTRKPGA